jgi:hypothetical protein
MRLVDLPILLLLGTLTVSAQDSAASPSSNANPKTSPPPDQPAASPLDAPIEIGRPVPAIAPPVENAVLLKSAASTGGGANRIVGGGEARWIDFENRRYGGSLGDAFATPQPWQFLNPFAPTSYGDGTRYLRQDPYTGRAEGVILFSIRFPGSESSKSLANNRAKQAAKAKAASPSAN